MKKTLPYLFIIIFGLVMYVLTIKGMPGNPTADDIRNKVRASEPFELSPERGRYALVVSLAENRSFSLSETLGKAAEPDVGYYQNKPYIYFAPGISILALPLYYLGKIANLAQVGAFFTISLIAILNQIVLFAIAKHVFKLPTWTSILLTIIFAFASTSWSYAVTLYQHHLTTFFILSGFFAAWKYRQRVPWYPLYAVYIWAIYGLSIFVDYPNAILLMPVMIYFFLSAFTINHQKNGTHISFNMVLVATAIIFFLITALHAYYNQVNFGHWSKLSGSLTGYKEKIAMEEAKLTNDTETIKALTQTKNIGTFFSEYSLPSGFVTLTVAFDKGLFFFSPIYLLAILGILMATSTINLEKVILISISVVNFFLYSSWGDPWGGWAFGPRYLLPTMAVFSLFIGYFLANYKHRILGRIATFLLLVISTGVALVGVLTTNQIPPKVEADFLGMKYNFLLNIDYLMTNTSSSYFYKTFASKFLDLQEYYAVLFAILILTYISLLFILPRKK